MPIISPEPVQDRDDTILGVAEKIFSEKGYQNAAIADIARLASVFDGLVYRNFENKRALLYQVLTVLRIMAGLEREVSRETVFERQLGVLTLDARQTARELTKRIANGFFWTVQT